MECLISDCEISWHYEGVFRKVTVAHIDQAVYSADHNAIVALVGADQSSKKVVVFEPHGTIRCEILQPAETYFHYLGPNRGNDVAVFSTIYHIGWKDWWLGIDTDNREVVSLGEGR